MRAVRDQLPWTVVARMALLASLPWILAALVALLAAGLLIVAAGAAPLEVYRVFLAGTWGNGYGIGQVLFKATPLVFTGLSVSLALRAGLFNIGAEGQLTLGAFAAALVGAALGPSVPSMVAWPLCMAAAFAAGAFAGVIPGALKAWRGAHEVITTIMLNYVIRAAMVGAGAHLFLRETIHTANITGRAELPRLWLLLQLPSLRGSAVNAALGLALIAAAAVWWLLHRTRTGFSLRALGAAPRAAETAGIPIGRITALAMALAGGLAGLGGVNFVLGYKHYYEDGFSGGVGYMGIAVAVVGRLHPLGVLAAALLFGTLSQGALVINAMVPKELLDVMQAVIILAVAAAPYLQRRLESSRHSPPADGARKGERDTAVSA